MMKLLLILIITIPTTLFLLAALRTAQVHVQPQEQTFLKGALPALPDGFKKGEVGAQTTWAGKLFDAKNGMGINIFIDNGKQVQRYPFYFSEAWSLTNDRRVIKLDYNLPRNPWYLRHVIDELVEISPGRYLGKLNLRLRPFTFSLGFFTLSNP
jgi:hypothetical protein